jgi:hypothetical protein
LEIAMIDETRRGVLKLFGVSAAVAMPTTAVLATAKEVALPALRAVDYTPPPAPAGFTYQWKRVFITADTPDLENILQMIAHGWKPVPADRHPETYPPNGSYWIEIGGMVLMEKPTKDLTPPRPNPMPWEEKWEHKEVKGWGGA